MIGRPRDTSAMLGGRRRGRGGRPPGYGKPV